MLSNTESGRMFYFNSFSHSHSRATKQGSRGKQRKGELRKLAAKGTAREPKNICAHQQFDSTIECCSKEKRCLPLNSAHATRNVLLRINKDYNNNKHYYYYYMLWINKDSTLDRSMFPVFAYKHSSPPPIRSNQLNP